MIPPPWRFYSPFGSLLNGGAYTWTIIDWDLRKWFNVIGSKKSIPEDSDAIKVSDDGTLLSVSSEDDPTLVVDYPLYLGALNDNEVLRRSQLIEVDRLGVAVDLVRAPISTVTNADGLVVFKYTLIQERVLNVWDDLNTIKALDGHSSFVPFHRIIIDDIEPFQPRVVGFTTLFMSGGNLEDIQIPFYFRWLHQLTVAVDDLNLKFGIMHQDIAPRNVLIDPTTKDLRIFDFDRAVKIGTDEAMPGPNDVDGVIFTVYEALTKDQHYRMVPFYEQDVQQIEQLSEWDLKVELEEGKGGLSDYRRFLSQWAAGRRTTRQIQHSSAAIEPLDWPEASFGTPATEEPERYGDLRVRRTGIRYRTRLQALKDGEKVICWERSPQRQTPKIALPQKQMAPPAAL